MVGKRVMRELIVYHIQIVASLDHLVAPGSSLTDKTFQDVR